MSAIADAESLPTLSSFLEEEWIVGQPDVICGLAVFPLTGGGAKGSFVSFPRAVAEGAEAKELPEQPSVNDIVIRNPTGAAVLLLDGEEVLGAQQNRVFDGSVLVPARTEMPVPVCCVERGRWDARGRGGTFRSSMQVSHPRLRGTMARQRDRTSGRSDQSAVWASVERSVVETMAASVTTAMDDAYAQRGPQLDAMAAAVSLRPGQRGAVVFIGGRFAALDWVASEEVWRDLHPRLVRGYAFDAVAASGDAKAPSVPVIERFVTKLRSERVVLGGSAGAATRVHGARADRRGAEVNGLVLDGELAQLSVVRA